MTAPEILQNIVKFMDTNKLGTRTESNREVAWKMFAKFFTPLPQWRRAQVLQLYCEHVWHHREENLGKCLRFFFWDHDADLARLRKPNAVDGVFFSMYKNAAKMLELLIREKADAIAERLFGVLESPKEYHTPVHFTMLYDMLVARPKSELLQIAKHYGKFLPTLRSYYGDKLMDKLVGAKNFPSILAMHLHLKWAMERDEAVKQVFLLLHNRLLAIHNGLHFGDADTKETLGRLSALCSERNADPFVKQQQIALELVHLLVHYEFNSTGAFDFGEHFEYTCQEDFFANPQTATVKTNKLFNSSNKQQNVVVPPPPSMTKADKHANYKQPKTAPIATNTRTDANHRGGGNSDKTTFWQRIGFGKKNAQQQKRRQEQSVGLRQEQYRPAFVEQLRHMVNISCLGGIHRRYAMLARQLEAAHKRGDHQTAINMLTVHLGEDMQSILHAYDDGSGRIMEKLYRDSTTKALFFMPITKFDNRLFDVAYISILWEVWRGKGCYAENEMEYDMEMKLAELELERVTKMEYLLHFVRAIMAKAHNAQKHRKQIGQHVADCQLPELQRHIVNFLRKNFSRVPNSKLAQMDLRQAFDAYKVENFHDQQGHCLLAKIDEERANFCANKLSELHAQFNGYHLRGKKQMDQEHFQQWVHKMQIWQRLDAIGKFCREFGTAKSVVGGIVIINAHHSPTSPSSSSSTSSSSSSSSNESMDGKSKIPAKTRVASFVENYEKIIQHQSAEVRQTTAKAMRGEQQPSGKLMKNVASSIADGHNKSTKILKNTAEFDSELGGKKKVTFVDNVVSVPENFFNEEELPASTAKGKINEIPAQIVKEKIKNFVENEKPGDQRNGGGGILPILTSIAKKILPQKKVDKTEKLNVTKEKQTTQNPVGGNLEFLPAKKTYIFHRPAKQTGDGSRTIDADSLVLMPAHLVVQQFFASNEPYELGRAKNAQKICHQLNRIHDAELAHLANGITERNVHVKRQLVLRKKEALDQLANMCTSFQEKFLNRTFGWLHWQGELMKQYQGLAARSFAQMANPQMKGLDCNECVQFVGKLIGAKDPEDLFAQLTQWHQQNDPRGQCHPLAIDFLARRNAGICDSVGQHIRMEMTGHVANRKLEELNALCSRIKMYAINMLWNDSDNHYVLLHGDTHDRQAGSRLEGLFTILDQMKAVSSGWNGNNKNIAPFGSNSNANMNAECVPFISNVYGMVDSPERGTGIPMLLQQLKSKFDADLLQQCFQQMEAKLAPEIADICTSAKRLQKLERMVHRNGAEFHKRMEQLDALLSRCNAHQNAQLSIPMPANAEKRIKLLLGMTERLWATASYALRDKNVYCVKTIGADKVAQLIEQGTGGPAYEIVARKEPECLMAFCLDMEQKLENLAQSWNVQLTAEQRQQIVSHRQGSKFKTRQFNSNQNLTNKKETEKTSIEWNYNEGDSCAGPSQWLKLSGCPTTLVGACQSPIALPPEHFTASSEETMPSSPSGVGRGRRHSVVVRSQEPLSLDNYRDVLRGRLINNGHTIQFLPDSNPALPSIYGGDLDQRYEFMQYHFHWAQNDDEGSEHIVGDKKYAGELHLVHKGVKNPGKLAVLAVFLEIDEHANMRHNAKRYGNDGMAKHVFDVVEMNALKKLTEFGAEVPISLVHGLSSKLPANCCRQHGQEEVTSGIDHFLSKFVRYEGSLTTPPCTENVVWTVFTDPLLISREQISLLRQVNDKHGQVIDKNCRPLQNLNKRTIQVFKADKAKKYANNNNFNVAASLPQMQLENGWHRNGQTWAEMQGNYYHDFDANTAHSFPINIPVTLNLVQNVHANGGGGGGGGGAAIPVYDNRIRKPKIPEMTEMHYKKGKRHNNGRMPKYGKAGMAMEMPEFYANGWQQKMNGTIKHKKHHKPHSSSSSSSSSSSKESRKSNNGYDTFVTAQSTLSSAAASSNTDSTKRNTMKMPAKIGANNKMWTQPTANHPYSSSDDHFESAMDEHHQWYQQHHNVYPMPPSLHAPPPPHS